MHNISDEVIRWRRKEIVREGVKADYHKDHLPLKKEGREASFWGERIPKKGKKKRYWS